MPKNPEAQYSHDNSIRLLHGGREYFDTLELLISKARQCIHLQVYIFEADETGIRIVDALVAAAERGVKVFFITDGYATPRMHRTFIDRLKNAGVNFRRFEPLLKNRYFYFGRRLHHKVFVADATHALVTGCNITDRYNDMPGHPAWKDYALYAHGDIARQLESLCCNIWNRNYGNYTKALPLDETTTELPLEGSEGSCSVRLRVNDWVKRKNQVWRSYFEMFNQAEDDITIMCSYFLPGWIFRRAMVKAFKRGVKIRVILTGRSDVAVAKYAERYLYDWMLKNGIEIYEYQPNILHAKIAMRDNRWMTVGSFNVNNISALASIELNLDVRNKPFVQAATKEMDAVIANDCIRITHDNYTVQTGLMQRLMQRLAYEFVKIVLFIVTFYYKRER